MEGENPFTRSIIDELRSWDIPVDQMEGESGVTLSIIDELHSWDNQEDQMEGEGRVTQSIIHELILGISKEIKWKVKVVLLKVSLMNFILQISNDV